jgi:hypothetical protein
MTKYLQWLHDHMDDRHTTRETGNMDNKGNQEQKSIIESLTKIVGFIDTYSKTIN